MTTHGNKPRSNEFTVLATFTVAVLLSLCVGGVALILLARSPAGTAFGHVQQQKRAPTDAEYRTEAAGVLAPFLTQALRMTPADVTANDPAVKDLVDKTQERLLAMTVPSEERDAHLAFVLLLDEWKRAIDGDPVEAANVVARTTDVVAAYPWLQLHAQATATAPAQ